MKQSDVKLGQVYLTKVTPHVALQEVVVVEQIQDSWSGRTKFRVRRNLPGSPVLPKSRAASALHPLPSIMLDLFDLSGDHTPVSLDQFLAENHEVPPPPEEIAQLRQLRVGQIARLGIGGGFVEVKRVH